MSSKIKSDIEHPPLEAMLRLHEKQIRVKQVLLSHHMKHYQLHDVVLLNYLKKAYYKTFLITLSCRKQCQAYKCSIKQYIVLFPF